MKDKWPLKSQTAENTKLLRGPLSAFAMREVFSFLSSLYMYIAKPIFHVPVMKAKVSYLFLFSRLLDFLNIFFVCSVSLSLSDMNEILELALGFCASIVRDFSKFFSLYCILKLERYKCNSEISR